MSLAGASNHTGVTKISTGSLKLIGAASIPNTPLIRVTASGTLDASLLNSALSVNNGQTLETRGDVLGDVHAAGGGMLDIRDSTSIFGNVTVGTDSVAKGSGTIYGNFVAQAGASIDPSGEAGAAVISPSRDVRIRSGEPNSNQGGTTLLMVGPEGGNSALRSLLEFPLNSLPAGAQLTGDPVLTLTGAAGNPGSVSSSPTIELLQLDTEFFESQATWNRAKSGDFWDTPGGDLGSTLAIVTGPDPDAWQAGDAIQFSSPALTADIEANLGNANYDLAVKTDTESLGQQSLLTFGSRGNGTAPTLSLSYLDATGIFAVGGDYAQHEEASLTIDIANWNDYDKLAVSGEFAMGGELSVGLSSAYTPLSGDSFDIFDFSTSTGMFDVLNFPSLPSPLVWDLSQLTTTGTLWIASDTPDSADFDLNGRVDESDLLVWGSGFGFDGDAFKSLGDADADGDIDTADLMQWQRQYEGSIQRITATRKAPTQGTNPAAIVPEPSGVLLAALWLAACGFRRRAGFLFLSVGR